MSLRCASQSQSDPWRSRRDGDTLRAPAIIPAVVLGQAIEAEVLPPILKPSADLTDVSGRRRIVRHGTGLNADFETGIGACDGEAAKSGDRDPTPTPRAKRNAVSRHRSCRLISLASANRSRRFCAWLYLEAGRESASGDFWEALAAVSPAGFTGRAGPDGQRNHWPAESSGRVGSIRKPAQMARPFGLGAPRQCRPDGVYFSPRMDHDKQCVLVIIGADFAMGNKDIVGMVDGYRESAQSWKELLLDLKRRGLADRPRVGQKIGDGALGPSGRR